jgi:hypothetical protein
MRCPEKFTLIIGGEEFECQCRLVAGHTERTGRRPKMHMSQLRRYIGKESLRRQQVIVVRWTE